MGYADLYDEAKQTLAEVDEQIKAIKDDIARSYPEDEKVSVTVWYWKDDKGSYLLSGLLVARANLLSTMANLKMVMTGAIKPTN
jgi:ABC-type Fe3+-hydroxamate transport system substrate-binding protein